MTTSREVPISLKTPLNNMENIIEVRNLKYKYDNESENYTLNDVSFQVKKGEWLSIVGHNGSGKRLGKTSTDWHGIPKSR